MDKPDNILQFLSDSSAFTGFTIEQRHAPNETIHDHVERPLATDGWSSTVVNNATGVIRGPFAFTGDAIAAMKAWASEKTEQASSAPTRVDIPATPTSTEGDADHV